MSKSSFFENCAHRRQQSERSLGANRPKRRHATDRANIWEEEKVDASTCMRVLSSRKRLHMVRVNSNSGNTGPILAWVGFTYIEATTMSACCLWRNTVECIIDTTVKQVCICITRAWSADLAASTRAIWPPCRLPCAATKSYQRMRQPASLWSWWLRSNRMKS